MDYILNGELFHGLDQLNDSAFKCPLSMFCPMLSSEEEPAHCADHCAMGRSSNCFRGPSCVP